MTMPSPSGTGPYTSAFRRSLQKSANDLTQVLRQGALHAGWDPASASLVAVEERDGHLAVVCPDEVADRVLDVEYGTTEDAPKAAVRKFADSTDWHRTLISNAMEEVGLL